MILSLVLALAVASAPVKLPPPTLGQQAPAIVQADCDGKPFILAEALKRGPVILAFFPKAQTSGCTQEMEALVAHASDLDAHHAQVVAVSADSAEALKTFRDIVHATFTFLPDTHGDIMSAYGAKMPLITLAKRRTFVIAPDGRVVHTAEGKDAIALAGIDAALNALKSTSSKPQ